MSIVSQRPKFDNPKKFMKWDDKKELNQKMAKQLLRAGFLKRSFRMKECSQNIHITTCKECGNYEITNAKLCRDRLCPICSWRLSVKRYAEMSKVCEELLKDYPDNEWSFLTLTVKNCEPSLLGATLGKMAESFNRMRQRKVFKDNIVGWARTVETTFNLSDNPVTVHPHFHVLIVWKLGVDRQTEGARLKNAWEYACKDLVVSYKGQHIEDIEANLAEEDGKDITGAVLETFKYTQKSSDLLSLPVGVFRDYAVSVEHKRMIAFGGIIKQYMKKLHFSMNDEAEEPQSITICKNCGNKNLSEAVYKWSFAERSYLFDPKQAYPEAFGNSMKDA